MPLHFDQRADLIIIGGGASGFMGAITAAEEGVSSVLILEATTKPLEKVAMSGGGRCNLTNACWDPKELVNSYPRGQRPLLGLFSRFASGDAVAWFEEKGLKLVEEEDGRMFPVSNSSSQVVECLLKAAFSAGVNLFTRKSVKHLEYVDVDNFSVHCQDGSKFLAKRILIATGGHPSGRKLASNLSHRIVLPVPSLFTFTIDATPLTNCSGIALNNVEIQLSVGRRKFEDRGRLLITHWGLSGPSILRLSAFAARDLFDNKYKASLTVNWLGCHYDFAKQVLRDYRIEKALSSIASAKPFTQLPKRLWTILLQQADINQETRWANFSSKEEHRLLIELLSSHYFIKGRGPFGEEFVTAGGVNLDDVQLRTMESRLCKGLYFSGELLDIDGLTGGFNFQHCWTSGWLAGKAIADSLQPLK